MITFRKTVIALAILLICGAVFLILNGKWPLDKVGDTYTGINIPNDQSTPVELGVTSMREVAKREQATNAENAVNAPEMQAGVTEDNLQDGRDIQGAWTLYNPPLDVPEITFYASPDEPVRLNQFMGSKLVVNLWATWCAPCVEELPTLAALKQRMIDDNAPIQVIAVSMDSQQDFEDIRDFLFENNADILPAYMDTDNQFMQNFNLSSFPVTYVFNEDAQMIAQYDRPMDWADPAVIERLKNFQ
tara:strand:+ start:228 stop:962 length:735 start_codon:yes stop_codon:yes gene_type:complete